MGTVYLARQPRLPRSVALKLVNREVSADPEVRRRVCDPLGWIGVRLDPERNERGETRISADGVPLPVYVIPTDEERLIARETLALL